MSSYWEFMKSQFNPQYDVQAVERIVKDIKDKSESANSWDNLTDFDEYEQQMTDQINSWDNLPQATFATRLDDLIWSDCHTCRNLRFGLVIGAFIWPTLMAFGLYYLLK